MQGKLLPKFKSPQELAAYLGNPTWRVHDVVPDTSVKSARINSRVVHKMLKLSGLDTNISKEQEEQWIAALNTQVALIDHLDDKSAHIPHAMGPDVFRLLASDHHPPEPLTLARLMEQVENIDQHVDAEKGEQGFDTSSLGTVVHEQRKE